MIDRIKEIVGNENVLINEPMSKHTSFRTGGNAGYFINVEDEAALKDIIYILREEAVPYYILGNGSNILVSDEGYDGVILHFAGSFTKTEIKGNRLYAGAAVPLSAAASHAAEAGLTGMEFAHGIPGTVGGALVMNAGAYGGEMSRIVESVRLLDQDGQIHEWKAEEMEFGYRSSILKKELLIALSAVFSLQQGIKSEIVGKMNELMAARKEKQPLEYPSAGSTFKRPEGHFAGKLIQDAGLRGYSIGGAQVSEKHCGFIINTGNATASDIYCLIREVQRKVKENSGVILEPEVIFLGEFEKKKII